MKSKTFAILLALIFGGLGAHKFYLGSLKWGVVYLLFSWTGIPTIIGFVEAVIMLTLSKSEFHSKYSY